MSILETIGGVPVGQSVEEMIAEDQERRRQYPDGLYVYTVAPVVVRVEGDHASFQGGFAARPLQALLATGTLTPVEE